MLRGDTFRVGILCVLLGSMTLSCGERTATEPDLPSMIVAAPSPEAFLTSPQRETRELLIDGRATDIEWQGTGQPTLLLMRGDRAGGGGDFYASVRALWSYNSLNNDSVAVYFLIDWPDRTENRFESPLVTDVNWQADDGSDLIDCSTDDALVNPAHWHRSELHEDQVVVELYSDDAGSYPADKWRWGAATTDELTPVAITEFQGAGSDGDTLGSTSHPTAGVMDDFYSTGGAWVPDIGFPFRKDNFLAGTSVPIRIANKGSRDTRLNRAKPLEFCVWEPVSSAFTQCDSLNPIRLDDPGAREKSWNPGDFVPSFRLGFPKAPPGDPTPPVQSQLDVLARGNWDKGKWALEVRRLLRPRPDPNGPNPTNPWPDDVLIHTGHTYGIRITIYDGSKTIGSASALVPLYIKPRS